MSKSKDKGRRKIIRDPVLGFVFYLQDGGDEYEAFRWLENMYPSVKIPKDVTQYGDPSTLGSFGRGDTAPYVGLIWLSKKCGGGTMAHEVAHAVTNVCRVLDMNPVNSDEFYASYAGWLFKEVNLFFQGKKK